MGLNFHCKGLVILHYVTFPFIHNPSTCPPVQRTITGVCFPLADLAGKGKKQGGLHRPIQGSGQALEVGVS